MIEHPAPQRVVIAISDTIGIDVNSIISSAAECDGVSEHSHSPLRFWFVF